MKVLFAYRNNLVNDNLFVKTLVSGLQLLDVTIDLSLDRFWDNKRSYSYDIIHIQWPEELFKWESISDKDLIELRDKLNSLRESGVKIVYTRHNLTPHYSDESIGKLYSIVETYSTAIVHMGSYSMAEYNKKYPGNNKMQVVIPHHIYENVYNETISRDEARRRLNIPLSKFVILSFGKFRKKEEICMTLKAFCTLRVQNKFLLAPRIFPFEKTPHNDKLINRLLSAIGYYVVYPFSRFFNTRLGLENELVTDADLPLYFSAADVVFIQRKVILNSGNIPTAFLFKKVVAGPDSGNLSEILVVTENPIFNPDDNRSIVAALEKAYGLSRTEHGIKNYKYACEHWGTKDIATQYVRVYKKLLDN